MVKEDNLLGNWLTWVRLKSVMIMDIWPYHFSPATSIFVSGFSFLSPLAQSWSRKTRQITRTVAIAVYYLVVFSLLFLYLYLCLQCFDAVGWVAGRASGLKKTEWWGAGMVICLERGADLHMAQLMPLPLTVSCSSKIQIGFTFLVPAHLSSSRDPGTKGR